ncbi:uroporphyrinogen-III C-methyltransferase [Panacibacter ginsenosidivorans]|uniref:uroporphyrinogen-III C-methyltransferase n=1 Tax=Panacibacter ginsenosidivorans TaxID=1813871 RepID=A0A5B8V4I5_9BACT|nr:uroporphyrinogen-III C-methyltransferase [Panacibacter ginsenosidivorans]QEC66290.1 uroporphyrinogen-III C-methyltransferase [Panacibacter ginsenosidivorans]
MGRQKYGTVYFIGAGPGDPDLLTIKAAKVLSIAEVVIVDRLVSEEILKAYVNPNAVIIPVGKQGRSESSTPQYEINDLIVQFASAYNTVVRLKGGDVALYSNVLDELITVNENNIPYEIIPGITAASGASAATGVPLTARGLSTGVRVLTYYQNTAIADEAWKHLASFEDTLVFYMTGNALPQLVNKLLQHSADATIPFLIVEQATTPQQYVYEYTLGGFETAEKPASFISPSLVIMGKVTALYRQFKWQANNEERKHYFKPLQDNPELISLINHIQEKHVSRA